eukprot:NODE_1192_length_1430_cov_75.499616_g1181_i0.p1 GENE.NODE_1192_length_1430_cov_75.499616_g1181_i0~~NODE_1192_length_1430_cov_75.499616_g1181_i0.p1  ORF type:complete len:394 (+),score=63.04 NODE_1192_length_1430_cov_75.499616_g1181_i0:86-1267(+)
MGCSEVLEQYANLRMFLLLASNFALVVFGGLVLRALEGPTEQQTTLRAIKEIEALGLTNHQLDVLEQYAGCKVPQEGVYNWDFIGSAFFSLTVATTIGYGSFTPTTVAGRLFTVLYSLVGFVVMGITLVKFTEQIMESLTALQHAMMDEKLTDTGALTKEAHMQLMCTFEEIDTDGSGEVDKQELTEMMAVLNGGQQPAEADVDVVFASADIDQSGFITQDELVVAVCAWLNKLRDEPRPVNRAHIAFAGVCLAALLLIGAGYFASVEGWTYGDGLWFCFISLTTIGFGDYAPSVAQSKLVSILYVPLGLGLEAFLIGALTQLAQEETQHFRKLYNLAASMFKSKFAKPRPTKATEEDALLDAPRSRGSSAYGTTDDAEAQTRRTRRPSERRT